MGLQPIYGKEPHSLFRAGSGAPLGNIRASGIPKPPKLLSNFYSVYTHTHTHTHTHSINVAAGRIIQHGGPRVGD